MERKFKELKQAKEYQKEFRQIYGYNPSIFKVTTPQGKSRYSIIKPTGLFKL